MVFFSMANLIYAIGEHRMPFGSYFALDTVEGLFVNFDQVNFFVVEVVREVSLR